MFYLYQCSGWLVRLGYVARWPSKHKSKTIAHHMDLAFPYLVWRKGAGLFVQIPFCFLGSIFLDRYLNRGKEIIPMPSGHSISGEKSGVRESGRERGKSSACSEAGSMIIINKNLKHLPSRMSHWIYLRVYLVRIESFCMHDTIYAFLLNPNQ